MIQAVLDTNIFIRFLIKDIESQFKQAKEIFEKIEKGKIKAKISILVINETIWILENYYELKREIYLSHLLKLLALKNLKIIEAKKTLIISVLKLMQKEKFDFTDIYLSQLSKPEELCSFDKDFKRLYKQENIN